MDFIELLKVIFLGIVEGITEWLPVSSTGHMILVDEFITLKVSEAFWEMFLVVIQLGAVLAVVVLDFKKLWPFHMNDPARESNWQYKFKKLNFKNCTKYPVQALATVIFPIAYSSIKIQPTIHAINSPIVA